MVHVPREELTGKVYVGESRISGQVVRVRERVHRLCMGLVGGAEYSSLEILDMLLLPTGCGVGISPAANSCFQCQLGCEVRAELRTMGNGSLCSLLGGGVRKWV